MSDEMGLGVWASEAPKLEAHCVAIEFLTLHGVFLHEDHKRWVVYCTARRGAERLVPKTWAGFPVVRRMGKPTLGGER